MKDPACPVQEIMPFLVLMLLHDPMPENVSAPCSTTKKITHKSSQRSKITSSWRPSKNFGNAIANSMPKEPED